MIGNTSPYENRTKSLKIEESLHKHHLTNFSEFSSIFKPLCIILARVTNCHFAKAKRAKIANKRSLLGCVRQRSQKENYNWIFVCGDLWPIISPQISQRSCKYFHMCTIVLGLLPSPLSEHRRGQCPLNHEILDLRVHSTKVMSFPKVLLEVSSPSILGPNPPMKWF